MSADADARCDALGGAPPSTSAAVCRARCSDRRAQRGLVARNVGAMADKPTKTDAYGQQAHHGHIRTGTTDRGRSPSGSRSAIGRSAQPARHCARRTRRWEDCSLRRGGVATLQWQSVHVSYLPRARRTVRLPKITSAGRPDERKYATRRIQGTEGTEGSTQVIRARRVRGLRREPTRLR